MVISILPIAPLRHERYVAVTGNLWLPSDYDAVTVIHALPTIPLQPSTVLRSLRRFLSSCIAVPLAISLCVCTGVIVGVDVDMDVCVCLCVQHVWCECKRASLYVCTWYMYAYE